MRSCLYEGVVQHQRLSPAKHVFRYAIALAYLDLDELPTLLAGGYGLSSRRFAPAAFRRADHFGDPETPLADAVRALVCEHTGSRPGGPIGLLTLLRNWGYYFCPLSLYYCFDSAGERVESIVAEVSNTPWLERHCYVLHQDTGSGGPPLAFRHGKAFHVSPFLDMNMQYAWHFRPPGERLSVSIVNRRADERLFDVAMVLKRREWNRRAMLGLLARHPWMTGRVTQAIYWQAFRLWRKKCPFYSHPKHRRPLEEQPS